MLLRRLHVPTMSGYLGGILSAPCGFFWMSKPHGAAENSVGIRLMWSALPAPMTAVFKANHTESSTVLPVLGREGSSTTSHINWFLTHQFYATSGVPISAEYSWPHIKLTGIKRPPTIYRDAPTGTVSPQTAPRPPSASLACLRPTHCTTFSPPQYTPSAIPHTPLAGFFQSCPKAKNLFV